MKFEGKGSKDQRSINFSTTGAAELDVYARSASSSAERPLIVYDANTDQAVGSITVDGGSNPIPLQTITISQAGDYYIASGDSGINVYYLNLRAGATNPEPSTEPEVVETPAPTVRPTIQPGMVEVHSVLDPSKESVATFNTDTTFGRFTIKATKDYGVDISEMSKVGDYNMSFDHGIKLNGTGSKTARSIHFSAAANSTLTVFALSGGAERDFALYSSSGDILQTLDRKSVV